MTNTTSLEKLKWPFTLDIKQLHRQIAPAFITPAVLGHFDYEDPAKVETHASDIALGEIVSQRHDGQLHAITFHS